MTKFHRIYYTRRQIPSQYNSTSLE